MALIMKHSVVCDCSQKQSRLMLVECTEAKKYFLTRNYHVSVVSCCFYSKLGCFVCTNTFLNSIEYTVYPNLFIMEYLKYFFDMALIDAVRMYTYNVQAAFLRTC